MGKSFNKFIDALSKPAFVWDTPKPQKPPKIIIHKDDYVCKKCNYGWTTKKNFGSPAFCPRCKSDSIIKVDRG